MAGLAQEAKAHARAWAKALAKAWAKVRAKAQAKARAKAQAKARAKARVEQHWFALCARQHRSALLARQQCLSMRYAPKGSAMGAYRIAENDVFSSVDYEPPRTAL